MLPSIFDEVFGDVLENRSNEIMKTDVRIVGDNYLLDIAIPGYEKNDIKLELEKGYLTVSASQSACSDEENGEYIRKERYYGKCSRTYYVGEGVNEDDIEANYRNGILTITVPKVVKSTDKKVIEIKD